MHMHVPCRVAALLIWTEILDMPLGERDFFSNTKQL